MHVKHKDWKLSSLLPICIKKKFPTIILSEKTSLFRHLETSRLLRVYTSSKKKSPPVKANARTFEIIKYFILIIILILMSLLLTLNIAWIKTWLAFQHYYMVITILYESESGNATLSTGLSLQYHSEFRFRQWFILIILCQVHHVFYWPEATSCQPVPPWNWIKKCCYTLC